MKSIISIEHCPDFETAQPFQYPEELPDELRELCDEYLEKQSGLIVAENLRHFLEVLNIVLKDSRHPQADIQALMHYYKIIQPESGTATARAESLKMSRQNFNYYLSNIPERLHSASVSYVSSSMFFQI